MLIQKCGKCVRIICIHSHMHSLQAISNCKSRVIKNEFSTIKEMRNHLPVFTTVFNGHNAVHGYTYIRMYVNTVQIHTTKIYKVLFILFLAN